MKFNQHKYLRAEHLLKDGRYLAATVKISHIVDECPIKRGDQEGQTTGVMFAGSEKVLGLNHTNHSQLCWELGDGKPEAWVGKTVSLVVRLVRNKKVLEPAIRVWPTVPNPNSRVGSQMGVEITEDWYLSNRNIPKVDSNA